MRGYIVILDKEVTRTTNAMYVSVLEEDLSWDSLYLGSTENIEEALFIPTDEEKSEIEDMLTYYNKDAYVYFVQVERNTTICNNDEFLEK